MATKVFVIGVGMTKFEKPGSKDWDYPQMAKEAAEKSLVDANIRYDQVQQAAVGYCYGDSTCGQRAIYEVGLTGIPVYNVNNNCSTGSTALMMGRQLVKGNLAECVMCLGFEKMEKGSLGVKYQDRTNPLDQHVMAMMGSRGFNPKVPGAPQMFGNAGREHMEKYGSQPVHFAKIAEKNHRHSALNPYSQFRDIYSLDQISASKTVYEPLTKLQCCPTSDGAAAVILASEAFVRRHGLESQAVEIIGQSMATDRKSSFEGSCIKMVGADMTTAAAQDVYRQSGLGPQDVQVIELHDCFSANELITYEALGLCKTGEGHKLVDRGDVTFNGKWVVNPSGGLISKGHPLGATGLAQCCELNWQLRGMCGERQVPNARVALQHNLGLGGAAVVTMYRHGFPQARKPFTGRVNPALVADSLMPQAAAAAAEPAGFQSDTLFAQIKEGVAADGANLVKNIKGVYQFNITHGPNGATKEWTIDLKNGSGSVSNGKAGKADCTITVSDANFMALASGKANPQQLFMSGKIKLAGNMALAMKLDTVLKAKAPGAGAAGAA
eukprot:CAMPEP_0119149014 /NCGR_PEP_ID=MMETSP1310-20130426/42727_1 /TAXON_ID=464262 /ORGANISM="Genus nov. species nov., Strain RCC2339" /LENGTH=551 /DNA_ID=CAMNT_0007141089 /DNA_START=131 /DNA_END=1782 /DNA_ORIENTATION=+